MIIRVNDMVRRTGGDLPTVKQGRKYRVTWTDGRGRIRLEGEVGEFLTELFRVVEDRDQWSDVRPGDTAEFEVQGDTLSIKAQGEERQPTVLGFKTTELDGVWDLLSIKKRNPPVPTRFGSRVIYRAKPWVLVYASMVPNLKTTKHHMVWIEIDENHFNWVGHKDIDRETFEVVFEGWQNL
jgi:hypothetical protein